MHRLGLGAFFENAKESGPEAGLRPNGDRSKTQTAKKDENR